jgi:GT2 family glycosyltransferase
MHADKAGVANGHVRARYGATVPVTVIIASHNTKALVRACIASVLRGSAVPETVFVVDNASTDGTRDMLAKEFPGVEVIYNPENMGFARANNQGLARARTPYSWLLNSDTEVGAHTLAELVYAMDMEPMLGAASPLLVYPDGRPQPAHGSFPGPLNVLLWLLPAHKLLPRFMQNWFNLMAGGEAVEYVSGAALFVRTEAVHSVGCFDDRFFMYFEEVDLCKKLADAHWTVKLVHAQPVVHIGGGSFAGPRTKARLRAFIASLELFICKHSYGLSKAVMLAEIRLLGPLSVLLKSI